MVHFSGQPKVDELDFVPILGLEHDVLRLDIQVDNLPQKEIFVGVRKQPLQITLSVVRPFDITVSLRECLLLLEALRKLR